MDSVGRKIQYTRHPGNVGFEAGLRCDFQDPMLCFNFAGGMIRGKSFLVVNESLDQKWIDSELFPEGSDRSLRKWPLASEHLRQRRVVDRELMRKRPQRISWVGLATLRQNALKMKSETPIHGRMIGNSGMF